MQRIWRTWTDEALPHCTTAHQKCLESEPRMPARIVGNPRYHTLAVTIYMRISIGLRRLCV